MPKISTIIPTYNGVKYIRQAIESVLDQTYRDFEIVVVDDGSTDNTKEAVESFGNQVRYFYQENRGPGSARNFGIKNAKGDYIALLDHDDLWLSNRLEKEVELLDQQPEIGLVYADAHQFSADLEVEKTCFQQVTPHSGFVFEKLWARNFIPNLTVLVRKECYERLGVFDVTGRMIMTDDYHMWLRIAAHYPIAYIEEPLAKYRIHKSNFSGDFERFCLNILFTLQDISEKFSAQTKKLGLAKNRRFSEIHYKLGKYYYLNGNSKAINELFISVKSYPLFWKSYAVLLAALFGRRTKIDIRENDQ